MPGKFHGWRSLAGYSPWGHKELDVTKHTPSMGAETAKETEKLKRGRLKTGRVRAQGQGQVDAPSGQENL